MSSPAIILRGRADRERAHKWVDDAPSGATVLFRANKRSTDQNSLLWARLGDIAKQVEWYGQKLGAQDWKDMFTASLRKARVVPGLDPGSFVLLGLHTSQMTKSEMTDLLDLIDAFAAEKGVTWHWEAAA